MDKDESYENMAEAQLSHNQDLDYQEQEEENSQHIMQVIRATSVDFLGKCITMLVYAKHKKK